MKIEEPTDARLENLLRGLAPAAVSPGLKQSVDEELQLDMSWLNTPSRQRRSPRWLASTSWAALGAAAAVAVMSYLPAPSITAPAAAGGTLATSTPTVMPVSTIREWEDVKDEGIHYNQQRLPEQHVRVITRDRQSWIDPRDGAQITVEIPREQRLVLPVAFQ
ncbi:MAG: hypothetical protein IAE77_19535 [Prosthecobacter sp.]|jgi:hypothetical protein|uniref:hypothetical protein n=1 Tax=Prosthecobacter sp. TaxID=1965333 RepID=UPI0019F8581C|nr:hypothetical protein [Prosthecobacter sp.]MBE2285664.1 hypothetical protein [Prosthecobacter sp.]